MLFKLAAKNLKSKISNTVLVIFSISIIVAMVFAMASFRPIINDYINEYEVSTANGSDITILPNSGSSRITSYEQTSSKYKFIPTLSLYPQYGQQYVNARGMRQEDISNNKTIEIYKGTKNISNPNEVIISQSTAKKFKLKIGDTITLKSGTTTRDYYVVGIAKNKGYFIKDNPNVILGVIQDGIAHLIGETGLIYNELYVKLNKGVSTDSALAELKEKYKDFQVKRTGDNQYIKEQTDTIVAPMVVAGPIVIGLAIISYFLLFMLLNRGRKTYNKKLRQIGATKKDTVTIFFYESLIMSLIAALFGIIFGIAITALTAFGTLKSISTFKVQPIQATLIPIAGVLLSIALSFLFGAQKRKNNEKKQVNKYRDDYKAILIVAIISIVVWIVFVSVEIAIPTIRKAMAIPGILMMFIALSLMTAVFIGLFRKNKHLKNPIAKLATGSVGTQKRHTSLAVGLFVAVLITALLFSGFGVSKKIFNSYLNDFRDFAFVTNIRESAKLEDFKNKNIDYDKGTKAYWGKGEVRNGKLKFSSMVLGSADILDFVDFKYTDRSREEILEMLNKKNAVVMDSSKKELYGLKVGDKVTLNINGKDRECEVVGFVSHTLFAGNYTIMKHENIKELFGERANTFILKKPSGKNMNDFVSNIRNAMAEKNYYAVSALDAFKWEASSTNSIFNFMGFVAGAVLVFSLFLTIGMSYMERQKFKKERQIFIQVGGYSKDLLKIEILENGMLAAISSIMAIVGSVFGMMFLVDSLRLLGMLFSYTFIWWIPLVISITFFACYTIAPIVLKYGSSYNIRE